MPRGRREERAPEAPAGEPPAEAAPPRAVPVYPGDPWGCLKEEWNASPDRPLFRARLARSGRGREFLAAIGEA